jgi:hypothetical protein
MATTFPQDLTAANPTLDADWPQSASESAQAHPSSFHPSPARAIETRTELFLLGALAALAGSFLMRAAHQREASAWLGRAVKPLLQAGAYNEVVKRGGFSKLLPDRQP